MARFLLRFLDAVEEEETFITCNKLDLEDYPNLISIHLNDCGTKTGIWLDKSTAIKFAKTLRTEINKIKQYGGR